MSKVREKQDGDDKILTEARARFKLAQEMGDVNRTNALDDLKFTWNIDDYQWPREIKKQRKNRPRLTENRLPQFLRQVVNAQRQNRPSIDVAPANSVAGVPTAQVMEGMIRHIEQWSKADLAYDNAFEFAAMIGFGYFRVTTEYADDEGFDQEICINPIDNPFSVYEDPSYSKPDGSDRQWVFVTDMVERDGFKDKYGVEPIDVDDVAGLGDDAADWYEGSKVRVAEYWRVVTDEDEITDPDDKGRKRAVKKRRVEQYLMTGDQIIKQSDWPGKFLPIIPVYGEVKNIEGKKYYKSLIRDAKSAQQVNNFFLSAEVETTALQPKAPFVGAAGQFRTDKGRWNNAHSENYAYLEYDIVEGAPGPPQRQPPPTFPTGLREARMGSIEAMKAIMGIYDASLGARTNEVTGVAIKAREEQGDNATYHFVDNMVRAIRYAGEVVIDLIPKIYDVPRTVRIVQPDGQAQMIAINQIFIDPMTAQEQNYDVRVGRYDVVVKAGPSFQTLRQHTAAGIKEMVRAYPPLMQLAGDLLFKNMDFPEADKIAERLAPKPAQGMPPELQQQMQGMQQALQQGKQAFDQLQQKANKLELENQRKDIEKMLVAAQAGSKSADSAADRDMEHKHFIVDTMLELLKMQQAQQSQATQLAHKTQLQDSQQAHQVGQQSTQLEHQSVMAQAQAFDKPTEQLVDN